MVLGDACGHVQATSDAVQCYYHHWKFKPNLGAKAQWPPPRSRKRPKFR
jgi:nitrite reductase/ring-hydroxylating ferredoxin subunit|eukprot:COSAG01_NODE_2675_length_7264_cov_29.639358_4_plen_49_part_00